MYANRDFAPVTDVAVVSKDCYVVNKDGVVTPIVERKGRYVFPGGYGIAGAVLHQRLRLVKLPGDAYRLVFLLEEEVNDNGAYYRSRKYLAEALGVSAARISVMLRLLEKELIVQRVGNRVGNILLNPFFYWRGSVEGQRRALNVWNENRPYNQPPGEPQ